MIKVMNITGGNAIFVGGLQLLYYVLLTEVKEFARPVLLSFIREVTVQVFPVFVKKLK
jgi:hypothetical protein